MDTNKYTDLQSPVGGSGLPSKAVLEAYSKYSNCLNLNATFKFSLKAKKIVDDLKDYIYKLTNSNKNDYQIIFTSGASESNSSLFRSILDHIHPKKGHFILNEAEHECSIEAMQTLEKIGRLKCTYVGIDLDSKIKMNEFINLLNTHNNINLVSIMTYNNELSSINDLDKIYKLCKSKNIRLHSDISQSFGKISFDLEKIPLSAISISPHKWGALPGIGILMIKKTDIPWIAQISGSSCLNETDINRQGARGGTPPSGLIASCYVALLENFKDRDKKNLYITSIKYYFLNELKKHFKVVHIKDVAGANKLDDKSVIVLGSDCIHIALISFIREPMCNKKMRTFLEKNGILVSLSSVCQSTHILASHVVTALLKNVNENIHQSIKRGVVRFGFDERISKKDIDYTVSKIKEFMRKKSI